MLGFLLSKWGLRIGGGVLIVLLLSTTVLHYRKKWREEGAQEQTGKTTADAKKVWESEREILQAKLRQSDADRAAAVDREAAAAFLARQNADLAMRAAQQVEIILGQRQQAGAAIDRLRDDQLERAITDQLALRSPGDQHPCFYPGELRALAKMGADYPLCQKQNAALADQVGDLSKQIAAIQQITAAVKDQLAALERKTAALETYSSELEGHYAQAFNAIPRHRNAGQFLCGLVTAFRACRPPRINLPSPADLHKKAKGAGIPRTSLFFPSVPLERKPLGAGGFRPLFLLDSPPESVPIYGDM